MTSRAIPLIAVAFILYNVMALMHVDLKHVIFALPMPSTARWEFTWGDMLIIVTLVLLFVELLKSTYSTTSSLVDHGLSMLVMIGCLIEFLLVKDAGTSVFFIILFATIIDVIAGYTIGISVSRRSLNVGDSNN